MKADIYAENLFDMKTMIIQKLFIPFGSKAQEPVSLTARKHCAYKKASYTYTQKTYEAYERAFGAGVKAFAEDFQKSIAEKKPLKPFSERKPSPGASSPGASTSRASASGASASRASSSGADKMTDFWFWGGYEMAKAFVFREFDYTPNGRLINDIYSECLSGLENSYDDYISAVSNCSDLPSEYIFVALGEKLKASGSMPSRSSFERKISPLIAEKAAKKRRISFSMGFSDGCMLAERHPPEKWFKNKEILLIENQLKKLKSFIKINESSIYMKDVDQYIYFSERTEAYASKMFYHLGYDFYFELSGEEDADNLPYDFF